MTPGGSDPAFVRLTEISPREILLHMNDPRVAQHLPLLTESWDMAAVSAFVAAKEARWHRDGLGHWAILWKGVYAGWGGFQKEGADWDYGLVLKPEFFGLGARITRKALAFAERDVRIEAVTFLLAPSRRHHGALARLGAVMLGEVDHEGERFLKFRLETPLPGRK